MSNPTPDDVYQEHLSKILDKSSSMSKSSILTGRKLFIYDGLYNKVKKQLIDYWSLSANISIFTNLALDFYVSLAEIVFRKEKNMKEQIDALVKAEIEKINRSRKEF